MRREHIPASVQQKITNYYEYKFSNGAAAEDEEELLPDLPMVFRVELEATQFDAV